MTVEMPSRSNIGTLPTADTDERPAPRPTAHGSAVQAVFDDIDASVDLETDVSGAGPGASTYQALRQLWKTELGSHDLEPLVIEVGDAFDEWLDSARYGRDWVLLLESSRWKAGTETNGKYRAWYQYHLKLRERDDEGEFHKPPCALHVEILPQEDCLRYEDGNDLTLPYGEGSRVLCWTTWCDTAEEVESRMLDALELAIGADRDALTDARLHESRRLMKAEAHHRFHIGWKRQVIDALDQSRQLIAYGGQSEIEAHRQRQREGYLEAVLDADRWHLLGFDRTDWNIEMKVYQAARWAEASEDEPARHPKLEASFAGVSGDGQLPHVDEWDETMQTLRAVVSAHLEWAGVSRDELIADDYQPGPAAPEYEYQHPTNRRDQLRERYEAVSTELYREALKANTTAVYDILKVVATESGASYDVLEARTGLARSTIRYHVRRLTEARVVTRVGNPVLVVFPSLQVLDRAEEILRTIYPDDMVDDMNDRAEQRRERREERDDPDEVPDGDDDRDVDDDSTSSSSSGSSEWRYFGDVDLEPHQLANALERGYLDDDEVRIRIDRRDWVS